ncbi:MAG: lysylphosphatidylglycerol synthase transmembrane domain-containing protein [Candidatus Aminicenantales bacterium]
MSKKKDFLIFVAKLLFSTSIIVFLLIFKTSVSKISTVIKEANLYWLVLSFSLHAIGLLISAYRWQILIRAQGHAVPLGFLARSYLVGTFFNNFLPTRFGGDVVRIWDGSRYSRSLLESTAVVGVERFTGIVVLFLFAFLASLLRLDLAQSIPVIWVSLLIGCTGLALVVLFFSSFMRKAIEKIPDKPLLKRAKRKLIEFRRIILLYREKRASLAKAFFWAFLLQVNVILHYYLIGKAIHLDIPLLDYFIFIPIVLLILIIPITIGGLGLREGSYMEIFRYYGISPDVAVSFGLIDWAFGLIIGIAGGIIYTVRK